MSIISHNVVLDWMREARRRYPNLLVTVMNCVGSHVTFEGGSADGVWNMRCRLQELALSETAALLRDACEHPPQEPITFEYSGRE